MRASASMLSSTSRPICWIARPRTGAGTFAHSRWASRAAAQASRNVCASPRRASATTSSRWAGFVEATMPPGESFSSRPAMIEAMMRLTPRNLPLRARKRPGRAEQVDAVVRGDGGQRGRVGLGQRRRCGDEAVEAAVARHEPARRSLADAVGVRDAAAREEEVARRERDLDARLVQRDLAVNYVEALVLVAVDVKRRHLAGRLADLDEAIGEDPRAGGEERKLGGGGSGLRRHAFLLS